MRHAVIVTEPERDPVVFGSFKTPGSAAGFAALVRANDAQAVVVPINPGRAFDPDNPAQPKENM